ncbi:MFS transporter [Paraburkholderia caballeronis]|uniref:MFS transporter n=1 Tax=Paraburkholderia caballeronis TaxID=416943 RepID=UPI00106709E9|nr:MFS transporter [Paraburkholderia caballeronis]TDV06791.1 EmrB/QacA subfamily drug resistance transporter [Paraburkholderia caballeronis]TDV09971.1 EmrB/QacA subfamily drug resistance transporter [Paraburkholderia caballeronis]TDV21803.1 EmrB/QacA subfamily drug resistance transporter [Paraburkholderia caballeronis]
MTLLPLRKNALALAAVCLTSLMFGLEISSVPTVLATLESVLHADFREIQWIMNAYTLACTTVLMATGALADRFGRKRVYVASIVTFAVTSLICGLAQSAPVLIVSRFLQGMGGGAMLICQVAVLSHQFQAGRERSNAFGAWGIIFGIGLGFGPIVGGLIVAVANWQWVFLVHTLLSIVALGLAFAGVQESRDPHAQQLDLPGIVTLSAACFGLVYFITQGPDLGLDSPAALGIAAATAVSFVAFVFVEKRSPRPMFDFSVFRIRPFSGAMFGSMGMNFSYWPFMIYLPIYFQGALGYTSVNAGLSLLAYTLPTLVVPPLAERLAFRFGARRVIPLGLFTIGVGFMLMKFGAGGAHPSWLTMLPGCLSCGIGLGLTNTPVTNTATGSVSPNRAGMASGIDMSARLISLAINIAVMGFILVEGVLSHLARALAGWSGDLPLRRLAERVAAGSIAPPGQSNAELAAVDPHGAIVHAALAHGFGLVMLYGMVGAWMLALCSAAAFGPGARTVREQAELGECVRHPSP